MFLVAEEREELGVAGVFTDYNELVVRCVDLFNAFNVWMLDILQLFKLLYAQFKLIYFIETPNLYKGELEKLLSLEQSLNLLINAQVLILGVDK